MEANYVPRHDTQYEPATACSKYDCNMAAAADALRWWSLGLTNRSHQDMRALQAGGIAECTDVSHLNDGTDIADALHVLVEHFGVTATAYDYTDGQTWESVLAALDRGEFVISHGVYGAVPPALRGPLSRTFTGRHSVAFQRRIVADGVPSVRVGDGLSDAWMYWPEAIARQYMLSFPGEGFTFLRVTRRNVASKGGLANVRAQPTTTSPILRRISTASRLHCGGSVIGQSIGGNRAWYRVYAGKLGIGYVHTSVGRMV